MFAILNPELVIRSTDVADRIQPDVREPKAFFPGAIPFDKEQYKSLVKEMRLPVEVIDGTSAVGPLFWWAYVEEPGNPSDAHLRENYQTYTLGTKD